MTSHSNQSVFYLVILISCCSFIQPAQLPSGVKLCHLSDPKLKECFGINMADGIRLFAPGYKELGIPNLEPYVVPKIDIKGTQTGAVSLDQTLTDVKMYGLSECVITILDLNFDEKDCKLHADILSPQLVMSADFNIKGRLLMIPLEGDGHVNVTMTNLMAQHRQKCEIFMKNGKKHLRIVEYNLSFESEKVDLDFSGLFAENKELSEQVTRTLKENTDQLFQELKEPFREVFESIQKELSNRVFSRIPLNQIILE